MKWIFTCEHGGNKIPLRYLNFFKGAGSILESHRGYDPGALNLYNRLKELADFSQACESSRLLIEINRSLHHPQLFSEFTKNLPSAEKKEIVKNLYLPYRSTVEKRIHEFISKGEKVFHISVHSFTPVLNGKLRTADIGILYDPGKADEKEFAKKIKMEVIKQMPELKIKFNYPYLGKADGFTTYLRKNFPQNYVGIELEVNQKFSTANVMDRDLKTGFLKILQHIKNDHPTNK